MIYTVRTTSGRETIVIDMLESKVKAEKLGIKTIFHPAEIKGYIFVEGNLGEVQKTIRGVMHIRGLIEKPVMLGEIQRFLEQKKELIKVGIGDTVEIIGGPFKGEKGKINRVDPVKREVTVELLEATIPIPVTIATEFTKVIKAAKKEEKPAEVVEEKPKKEEPSVFEGITEERAEEAPEEEAAEEAEAPAERPEPVPEEKPEPAPEETPTEKAPGARGEEKPEAPPEEIPKEEPEPVPEEEPVETAEEPAEPVEKPEPAPEETPEAVKEEVKEEPAAPEEEGGESLLGELEEEKKKKKKKDELYDEED